jgi:hypothetical protein
MDRIGTDIDRGELHGLQAIKLREKSADFLRRSRAGSLARPACAPAQTALGSSLGSKMNASVTGFARSADFQRSFVAMRYYWGARGAELAAELDAVGVVPAAADVLASLRHEQRSERARALGAELGRLALELDRRGLWR